MSYMGVDLGTSGCRVIAIDEKGEIIASEKMSYQLKHGKNFFIELIPQDVLTAVSYTHLKFQFFQFLVRPIP